MNRCSLCCVLGVAALICAGAAGAPPDQPRAISPGSSARLSVVTDLCPTLSWTSVAEASSYEVVVLRVDDLARVSGSGSAEDPLAAETSPPIVRVRLPRGSSSWSASGATCLEAGGAYAWFVRAHHPTGEGEWSEELTFRTAMFPTERAELEALVEEVVVRVLTRAREGEAGDLPAPAIGAGFQPSAMRVSGGETRPVSEGELVFTDPAAIKGTMDAGMGGGYGVLGVVTGTDEVVGVGGEVTSTSGDGIGVLGVSHSPEGSGVAGWAVATVASGTAEFATGVRGESASPQGLGVWGTAGSTTGVTAGAGGESRSPDGFGGFFVNDSTGGFILGGAKDPGDPSTPDFWKGLELFVDNEAVIRLLPRTTPTRACASDTEGMLYFDDTISKLCFCDGDGWKRVEDATSSCAP